MVNQSPLPLHRTNINLYEEDVEWLRERFGQGWTEWIRDLVHETAKSAKAQPSQIIEVYCWENGNVMVFDQFGQQMPEFQGHRDEVLDRIKAAAPNAIIHGEHKPLVWKDHAG